MHSSAPEHAMAKLCMIMRVGRSRDIVFLCRWASVRGDIFCWRRFDQRGEDSSSALTL
jgi:hypothetical protein